MFVKIWEITLENTLAVSYEGKRILSLRPINPQRNENISPHGHLYVNIHSNCTCNSPDLEETQIFISW